MIPDKYKQRLTDNANEFDEIVTDICKENTELKATIGKLAELLTLLTYTGDYEGRPSSEEILSRAREVIKEAEANAEFIVKACNNHYQLLEALIDLQADIGGGKKFCGHDFTCRCAWDKAVEAIKEAEK